MIINGASRSNGAFFSRHLMRADHNERVSLVEMRGLASAEDVREAFRELKQRAEGTACKNYFYHANLNTREDEVLTPEQWAQAVNVLERELQLEGQPRFIIEHEKEGRTHQHVIWGRVDAETMTTIHDGHNYRRHEIAAREIEAAFDLSPVESTLTRDKETTPRPERGPQDWESFRAQESKIDPKAMKAELTELWQHSDTGPAFAAALEERGYILARGDRRDFCIIDQAGDEHSLGRRISGVKATEIRARMADVDAEALPSVAEGREMARQRQEEPQDSGDAPQPSSAPVDPFAAVLVETVSEATSSPLPTPQAQPSPTPGRDAFDQVMAETVQEERHAAPVSDEGGGRFERFRAWLGGMREYVADLSHQARDYWGSYFQRDEPEAGLQTPPGNVVTSPELDAQRAHQQQYGMEPGR